VITNGRSGTAFEECSYRINPLVQDSIDQRSVTEYGGLLVYKRSMIQQQLNDIGVARLSGLVQGCCAHAGFDCECFRPGCQKERYHLRLP
jgi:hypothetical protein